MPNIGWPELLIVLVIALVIFGPKRLPDMGRQLGRGLREFKKATSEIQDHFDLSLEEKDDEKKTPADVRPAAATTVPVAAAPVAQAAAETTSANAPEPVDAGAPVVVDAEAPVAVEGEAPVAVDTEAPEVVEGEVVGEEADHPAQTVTR